MRIEFEGSMVKFFPENAQESAQLDRLWKVVVGCVSEGRKLVPVGQFLPGSSDSAHFNVE